MENYHKLNQPKEIILGGKKNKNRINKIQKEDPTLIV